jgi:predicted glycogen debranching enzyme
VPEPIRRMPWRPGVDSPDLLLTREWLLTNGLGGYASATVGGVITSRYHGLLVAALPSPYGRTVMFNQLWERCRLPSGVVTMLGGDGRAGRHLVEFRLEAGLPVWRYELGEHVVEKQLVMPHRQNTIHITYRLLEGPGPLRLGLRPGVHLRPHHAPVSTKLAGPHVLTVGQGRHELFTGPDLPPLRLLVHGPAARFTADGRRFREVLYRVEEDRGYESSGELWSPGSFRAELERGAAVTVVGSTEPWDDVIALAPDAARDAEYVRRAGLIAAAHPAARSGAGAELVLAADQFVIAPRRAGVREDARSIIAGYPWFTDWGRDTMISLEGLTLVTGRYVEAAAVLKTFGDAVCDGLLPNLFPEGDNEGLYHTADATLWFFHAIDRYVESTSDRALLRALLPRLRDIVERHIKGTRFGIGMDAHDALLRQGTPGYQLTWMDAKVGDWVVTPRRGKAVEINALWYNALALLSDWIGAEEGEPAARWLAEHAERARASFNERFWYAPGGYLYDVVDGEAGDDPACRPNQILAMSLRHPVLHPARWETVLNVVARRLLTPVGLRTLSPDHPDYKSVYRGDLRARDAAYHQGTVWAWLLGPFVDAWLRVHPEDRPGARQLLNGLIDHLGEACLGSISEIFDADPPFIPRGCIAQAWSVAEALRVWVRTQP